MKLISDRIWLIATELILAFGWLKLQKVQGELLPKLQRCLFKGLCSVSHYRPKHLKDVHIRAAWTQALTWKRKVQETGNHTQRNQDSQHIICPNLV